MIYIASDHGGFELKNKIVEYLQNKYLEVTDLGPQEFNSEDDYPYYAEKVATVVSENPDDNVGILLCKNGVGVNIVANKFPNVRAALSWEPFHAKSTKHDDDSNILALPANYISEDEAMEIVNMWLNTPFSNEERHERRLEQVSEIENFNLKSPTSP